MAGSPSSPIHPWTRCTAPGPCPLYVDSPRASGHPASCEPLLSAAGHTSPSSAKMLAGPSGSLQKGPLQHWVSLPHCVCHVGGRTRGSLPGPILQGKTQVGRRFCYLARVGPLCLAAETCYPKGTVHNSIFGCVGSSLQCAGFSLWWLLLLQSTGSGAWASVVVAHGLSSCGSRA